MKRTEVIKQYIHDPLYRRLLNTKTPKQFNAAMATLKAIRGETAVRLFIEKLAAAR